MAMRARTTFLVATKDGQGVWVQAGQEVSDSHILRGREDLFEPVEDAKATGVAFKKK